MLTVVISFTLGVIIGALGAVFVARNNRNKVDKVLSKADEVSERYKNYMTKSDKFDGLK
jgi:uncharacterized membrane-anchored protein YhcB (DUF1043 family)